MDNEEKGGITLTLSKNYLLFIKILGILFLIIPCIISVIMTIKVLKLENEIKVLYMSVSDLKQVKVIENQLNTETEKIIENIDENDTSHPGSSSHQAEDEEEIKKVYITFDDGPSPITSDILEILDQYGVKATFFVVGNKNEMYDKYYTEIVERGHSIGLHSYSHEYSKIYQSVDAFEMDLMQLERKVYYLTNERPKIVRFPGGSSNVYLSGELEQFSNYLAERNMVYFDWNVVYPEDLLYENPEAIAENILSNVDKNIESNILLHDSTGDYKMLDVLPLVIEGLIERKIQIMPIDTTSNTFQHINGGKNGLF